MPNRDRRADSLRPGDETASQRRLWRVTSLALLLIVVPLLGACGPFGDDEDPTQTPTTVEAPDGEASPTPGGSPSAASPTARGSRPISVTGGRGTATVPAGSAPTRTPTAGTSGDAGPTATPPVADGCTPPDPLPPAADDGPLTTTDVVNLRDGPSTECDIVEELPEGTEVLPLSGPVEGDDRLWILVDVDGTEGWLAAEFVAGLGGPTSDEVAVLMYHHLDAPDTEWSVTSRQLDEQMAWLQQSGYESVTVSQLVDALNGQSSLPPKAVVITNDDGYAETTEFAAILARYGFVGTYYLPSAMALSAADVRDLEEGGGEICGHTANHVNLAELDADEQRAEIADNKELLEGIVGHPVRCFAYPYGAYNDETGPILEEVGYDSAVLVGDRPVELSAAIDPYEIPRVQALGTLTMDDFTANFPDGARAHGDPSGASAASALTSRHLRDERL